MVRKKRVGISNRLLYTFIAIGILAIVGIGVYAVAPSPGHSSTQIDFSPKSTLTNPELQGYIPLNVGGEILYAAVYKQPLYLVFNQHTESQCTSAGGTVVTDGGSNKFCRFSSYSCPSGWTQYFSWSTTLSQTCNGTSPALPNPFADTLLNGSLNLPCSGSSCTTGSHAFDNIGIETCSYEQARFDFSCPSTTLTCTASRTQVGCY